MKRQEVTFVQSIFGTLKVFAVARTEEEALHLWSRRRELRVKVNIDGKQIDDDLESRFAIEDLFRSRKSTKYTR